MPRRRYDVTLPVRNVIGFCSDPARHLADALREAYEGRCLQGALVLRVAEVVATSACHVRRDNASAEGYVDATFMAEVAVFSRHDILVGVTIASRQGLIVGTYEAPPAAPGAPRAKAAVSILVTPGARIAEGLAEGQRVAVRVAYAFHPPRQDAAAVIGAPLTCDQTAPVFRLRGVLDAAAAAELAPLVAAVEAELAARTELVTERKDELWFFERLLHAYREPEGPKGPKGPDADLKDADGWVGPRAPRPPEPGAALRNVLDVVRSAAKGRTPVDGLWSRSLALHRSSPFATVAPAGALPAGWGEPVDQTPTVAFAEFLRNIADFLVATRELVACYATPALVEQHRNIWNGMRAAQRA